MIDSLKFKIGNLEIKGIQGGMGVGVSLRNLASAAANSGWAGIIASVAIGTLKNYPGNYIQANHNALRNEIKATREMTSGVIGVNIMNALTDYESLVQASVKENVDLIISGAGLSKSLPELVGDKPIALVPIVANARVAELMTKLWSRYGKIPDAFIVEGPKAGGHLGYKYEDLINKTAPKLENLVKEVVDFANTINRPVIAAGGIYTGQDIKDYQELGAAGVQMGTRFVTTKECDASDEFKWTYLNSTKDDIKIIKSPVGMPGRAISNEFLTRVMAGEKMDFDCKFNCLKNCNPKKSPYCIAKSLIGAQQGNFYEGFAFAGSNAYRATPENSLDENRNFITIKTLIERISEEYHSA